jgi:hypothetical protein
MVRKTTNNPLEGVVRQHADDLSKTVKIDPGYELYSRIIEDMRALAAASDWEEISGTPAIARIHWSALAVELAAAGLLDRLNAQVDNLTTEEHRPSSKQIAPTVSLGEAMRLFLDGADAHDFNLKNRLVDAFMSATEKLDDRFTDRHWGMAVTDLARIAYLAETSEDAG